MFMKEPPKHPKECDGCCYRRNCDYDLEKCCYMVRNGCILTSKENYL